MHLSVNLWSLYNFPADVHEGLYNFLSYETASAFSELCVFFSLVRTPNVFFWTQLNQDVFSDNFLIGFLC